MVLPAFDQEKLLFRIVLLLNQFDPFVHKLNPPDSDCLHDSDLTDCFPEKRPELPPFPTTEGE